MVFPLYHTHAHTLPLCLPGCWAKVPLPKATGRHPVPVCVCVCDMKGRMCDINTQSGSFEFTHKGQLSACQSLSLSPPLLWCLLTTAEDVCWNVDMTNPKLCHLSLLLFQRSFSLHDLMSSALAFIRAGFVCVTNFVSLFSCFGSLPTFLLPFTYLPFFCFCFAS